jgi:hypothetical protein
MKKLYELLGLLIQDHDRRDGLPPEDWDPPEKLRYPAEISRKTPADLIPIFGQRSYLSEALEGVRLARSKLGKLLCLHPGFFL